MFTIHTRTHTHNYQLNMIYGNYFETILVSENFANVYLKNLYPHILLSTLQFDKAHCSLACIRKFSAVSRAACVVGITSTAGNLRAVFITHSYTVYANNYSRGQESMMQTRALARARIRVKLSTRLIQSKLNYTIHTRAFIYDCIREFPPRSLSLSFGDDGPFAARNSRKERLISSVRIYSSSYEHARARAL